MMFMFLTLVISHRVVEWFFFMKTFLTKESNLTIDTTFRKYLITAYKVFLVARTKVLFGGMLKKVKGADNMFFKLKSSFPHCKICEKNV